MVTYLKNLCELHLLIVKDGVDTVDSLLGLVRCSPLSFLMQDGNQSPDGNITDIGRSLIKQIISFHSSRCGPHSARHVDDLPVDSQSNRLLFH